MENRNNRVMTEQEYRKKIDKIRKDREIQEKLNQVAEVDLRKKVLPRLNNPPQPRPVARYVRTQPQPRLRGLLAPEPTQNGFMSLLTTTPSGSKG